MRVGVIGLGRVGLPLARVLAGAGGHDVLGHDLPERLLTVQNELAHPPGFRARPDGRLKVTNLVESVVSHSEVILVVVQTPHAEGYGGDRPVAGEPRDFEYGYLEAALREVDRFASAWNSRPVVGVVSTVLPGTLRRLGNQFTSLRLAYCPALISLGTVTEDLLHPDLVLVGADDEEVGDLVEAVFTVLTFAPVHRTSVVSAELVKVALNAYLSTKIVFANALMELAHEVGADVDDVTRGLALSDKVTSADYLRAGLGDGGACRPRDVIALSWLAQEYDLSTDPFGFLWNAREDQSWFIAGLARELAEKHRLEIVVLGEAYKPGVTYTEGSPARLLAQQLGDCPTWDPVVHPDSWLNAKPFIFVLATPHQEFLTTFVPLPGSVVVDPWRVFPDRDDVEVVRVGEMRRTP